MAYVTIHLVFSGLIAFAPNSFLDPSLITAYLVKSDLHDPQLSIVLSEVTDCSVGPCTSDTGECVCSLERVEEIFLQPATVTGVRYLRPEPPGVLPTPARAPDLAWLVRMMNVEAAAARIDSWEAIRPRVWTRMSFGWDYARNCAFDEVEESGDVRIRNMSFQRASQPPSSLKQAVSEEVAFESRVPAGPVKLVLHYRSPEGVVEKIDLKLSCGDGSCPDLVITNEAPEEACGACDTGVHFDHYYDLAKNRESLRRLLPVRAYEDYADSRRIGLRRCRKVPIPTIGSRVICPMALFDP